MTRFSILQRFALAAAMGLGLGAGAAAQGGPRVIGTGENASVEYDVPSANIVGGALERFVGSGDNMSLEPLRVTHESLGRPSVMVGSGESATTAFADEIPAAVFTGARRRD